nr:hybrid-proline-rich protein [Ipomoea batatas]
MASQFQALAILLLSLNIAFFYHVSCYQPTSAPSGGNPTTPPIVSPPKNGGGNPTTPPVVSPPKNGGGNPTTPPVVSPPKNGGGNPTTPPVVSPPSNGGATCPSDRAPRVSVCVGLLDLLNVSLSLPPIFDPRPCCSLIDGLVNLEATACLCAALQLDVLNILNANVTIGAALKLCGLERPPNAITC